MQAGILHAMGTLFMRGPVYEARTLAGELQWMLPLVSRDGLHQERYMALWSGAGADSFMRAHRAELRPGAAITLTLHRLRCVNGEILADVYSASMAPERWQHQSQTDQHASEHTA